MSALSAQRDELRWLADHLEEHESHMDEYVRAMRHAADTIWQLRNDCVDLRKENAKLRKLVSDYAAMSEYLLARQPMLFPDKANEFRKLDEKRQELGIKVSK